MYRALCLYGHVLGSDTGCGALARSLQRSEERLRHRIIVANPGPANRLQKVMIGEDLRELFRSVIGTSIRIKPKSV